MGEAAESAAWPEQSLLPSEAMLDHLYGGHKSMAELVARPDQRS